MEGGPKTLLVIPGLASACLDLPTHLGLNLPPASLSHSPSASPPPPPWAEGSVQGISPGTGFSLLGSCGFKTNLTHLLNLWGKGLVGGNKLCTSSFGRWQGQKHPFLLGAQLGYRKSLARLPKAIPAQSGCPQPVRGGVPWVCNATLCCRKEQLGRQAACSASRDCVLWQDSLTYYGDFVEFWRRPPPPQLPKFPKVYFNCIY